MQQYARVDLIHGVKDVDFVASVGDNDGDDQDADKDEKEKDHEEQVADEKHGGLARFLVEVQQFKVLIRDILPRDIAAHHIFFALLLLKLFADFRRSFLFLLKVLLIRPLNFLEHVFLF